MHSVASHTEYVAGAFENVQVDHKHLSGSEFHDCKFLRCSFQETTLERCRFSHCEFDRCDLSLVKVPATSFSETAFVDSKLIGIDWTAATWGLLNAMTFDDCTLNYGIFMDLDLQRVSMRKCTVEEADFRGANLSGVDLKHTDFLGSFFKHTNLEGADFSHASNYSIDANLNRIKGARFMLPEAISLLRSLDIVLIE